MPQEKSNREMKYQPSRSAVRQSGELRLGRRLPTGGKLFSLIDSMGIVRIADND